MRSVSREQPKWSHTHFGRGQTQFVSLSPHGPQVLATMVAMRGVRSRRKIQVSCGLMPQAELKLARSGRLRIRVLEYPAG